MLNFSKIHGGVHPEQFKGLTAGSPISTPELPQHLYVPLKQHAGSEAIAIVEKGEYVLKGQLIGKANGNFSANVHAPSSGIVKAVEPVLAPHPSGLESLSVVIELDGEDQWPQNSRADDPFNIAPEVLAKRVSDGGIVGMGGASFPAAVKLQAARRANLETLLINGGECEPYLTSDDRLMQERAVDIIRGARLIQHITSCKQIIIAVEDNKPKAIKALKNAATEWKKVEVVSVPSVYPMGSSKQIVQAVIGKEIPANSRTTEMGVLIHNVATAFAINACLTKSQPLISRIATIAGGAIAVPQNVEALIGTPIAHLIKHCGGYSQTPDRIVLGGPMMGQLMPSDQVPLIKGAGGVLALLKDETPQDNSSPCIRCGRCVSACPMGLVPLEMAKHSKIHDYDGAQGYGLKDCILCGSCAYVCPSHIPLVHYFQYAKGELSKQSVLDQRREYTKELASSRNARVEKEAAEKAAARAAKAAAKAAAKNKRRGKTAGEETASELTNTSKTTSE